MQAIIDQLKLVPTDESRLVAFQQSLISKLVDLPNPRQAFPLLFRFFERLPEADLGMPGPLVHWIEQYYPDYLHDLTASLGRHPTYHVVWMASRILNSSPPADQRRDLIRAISAVEAHPQADALCKETARQFLGLQLERDAN